MKQSVRQSPFGTAPWDKTAEERTAKVVDRAQARWDINVKPRKRDTAKVTPRGCTSCSSY